MKLPTVFERAIEEGISCAETTIAQQAACIAELEAGDCADSEGGGEMTAIGLWEWLADNADDGMSHAELIDRIERFAQERAERAEEAGYTRGVEAAISVIDHWLGHGSACGCWGSRNEKELKHIIDAIHTLLPPDPGPVDRR